MKNIKSIVSVVILVLFAGISGAQNTKDNSETISRIIEKNESFIPEECLQLVLVYTENSDANEAVLIAFEKSGKEWQIIFDSIPAGIGRNGFAMQNGKREGDGKSPSGIFSLGQLFTYESTVKTAMPFIQSTEEDKWIDDVNSPDYNTHVRGKTNAKSFENLLLKSDYYKYCMVIEYNTTPVKKGMGSAIFFHLNKEKYETTSGCIAILEAEMLNVLGWMNSGKKPMILMGSGDVLCSGLK